MSFITVYQQIGADLECASNKYVLYIPKMY